MYTLATTRYLTADRAETWDDYAVYSTLAEARAAYDAALSEDLLHCAHVFGAPILSTDLLTQTEST